MRKLLSIGDGVPMTMFTLMVCGPVLFGLALILFEPLRDPFWMRDLIVNPGRHPVLVMWLLIPARAMLTPSVATDDDGGSERNVATTELKWTSDMLWAMTTGVLLCLMLLVDETTVATGRENIAAYAASGIVVLSIALSWRDRRERNGFRPDRHLAE